MNPAVEAWIVIEKLAALCATPGISEDVQKEANSTIQKLLADVIKPPAPGPLSSVDEVPSTTNYYDGSLNLNVA